MHRQRITMPSVITTVLLLITTASFPMAIESQPVGTPQVNWNLQPASVLSDVNVRNLLAPSQSTKGSATVVSAGGEHTCAVTAASGVKCWGGNLKGQLGDGTTIDRQVPTDVSGLSSGVTAVSAGNKFTCALTSIGGVKCWGYNDSGQVGDGTTTDRYTPVEVIDLASGVTAISAGSGFTCVLASTGGVKCWGYNYYGELGDGTNVDRYTPVDVSGLSSGIIAITAGTIHACALTSTGGVKCWGDNQHGQLGDGTTTHSYTPVDVSGLASGVIAISAGYHHTCALTSTGGVKCWGNNGNGQLGDGTTTDQYTPVDVTGLTSSVTAISAGTEYTCALTSTGGVKCWGLNDSGQLGDGTTTDRYTPVDVSGLSIGMAVISAGWFHTCALTSTGAAICWGSNEDGQLGNGTIAHQYTPIDVGDIRGGVTAISAGYLHNCELNSTGGVKCWGSNRHGELGAGMTEDHYTPVDVSGLSSGVTAISSGSGYTCALTSTGGAICWGNNHDGQLGDGTTVDSTNPVNVIGISSGATGLSTGESHTCAAMSTGAAKCWGRNYYGMLGGGTGESSAIPIDVTSVSISVTAILAGGYHTCVLTYAGGAKCWGYNNHGQLGDGSNANQYTSVDVSGLTIGVSAIATGWEHTCALTSTGGVKCWGANMYGQLGDGTNQNRLFPVDVSGLTSGVVAISAGVYHTCALTSTGGVKCWGNNGNGQLGDGTLADRYLPVDVHRLSSGATAISAGMSHTCAVTAASGVKCWGGNLKGQLGVNPGWTPANVLLATRLIFPVIAR